MSQGCHVCCKLIGRGVASRLWVIEAVEDLLGMEKLTEGAFDVDIISFTIICVARSILGTLIVSFLLS